MLLFVRQWPGIGWVSGCGYGCRTLRFRELALVHQWSGIPYGDVAIQSAMKMIYNIAPPAHITAKNEEPRLPCVCLAKPQF